jgi:hypothetical protein
MTRILLLRRGATPTLISCALPHLRRAGIQVALVLKCQLLCPWLGVFPGDAHFMPPTGPILGAAGRTIAWRCRSSSGPCCWHCGVGRAIHSGAGKISPGSASGGGHGRSLLPECCVRHMPRTGSMHGVIGVCDVIDPAVQRPSRQCCAMQYMMVYNVGTKCPEISCMLAQLINRTRLLCCWQQQC